MTFIDYNKASRGNASGGSIKSNFVPNDEYWQRRKEEIAQEQLEEKRRNLIKSQEETQRNIEEFQKQRNSLGGRFYGMFGAMPTLPSLSIEGEDYTRAREEDEADMSAKLAKPSPVQSYKKSVSEKGFVNTVGDIEVGAAENLAELASGTAKLAIGFTPFGGYSNVRKIAKFVGNDQVDEYIDRNTPEWQKQTGSWLDENGILNYKADYKNEMQKAGGVVAEIGTFFIPITRAAKLESAIALVPKFAKILGTAPKVAKIGGKFALEVALDVIDNASLDAMRGQDADTILENAKYSAIGGAGLRVAGGGIGAALKNGKTNRLIATIEESGLGKLSDDESKIARELIDEGKPVDDVYTRIIEKRSEEGTLADDFGDILKEDAPAVKTSATTEIPKIPKTQDSPQLPEVPARKNVVAPETKPGKVETPKVETTKPVESPVTTPKVTEPVSKPANVPKAPEKPVEAKVTTKETTLSDVEHARGVLAARDIGGIQAVGAKNVSAAEKTLQKAGELPMEIKTKNATKDFIKDYYTTKKPPVVGDVFINSRGERIEITKVGDDSAQFFLKGKKKGIAGTVYSEKPFLKISKETPKVEHKVETTTTPKQTKSKEPPKPEQKETHIGKKVDVPNAKEPPKLQEPAQPTSSRLTKLEGTGEEKVRGVARSTVKKAVASGFDVSGEMLPKYKQHNQKAELDFWSNKISSGEIDFVRSVANAEIEPPKGFSAEGAYIALTETADKQMIEELIYNSAIVEEATTMGQRISMWQQLNPFSAVKVGSDIIKERVSRMKYDKVSDEKTIRKSLEFKVEDAKEIINSLICK